MKRGEQQKARSVKNEEGVKGEFAVEGVLRASL